MATLPGQFFGTIETKKGLADAMFCMDRDRPHEAMLHWWWKDDSPPVAMLVKGTPTSKTKIELRPIRLYKADKGGGLIAAPPLSPPEQEVLDGFQATLQRKNNSFVGAWTHAVHGTGKIVLNPPPRGPKIKAHKCKTWDDFKKWVSRTKQNENIALFRGHGSSEFSLSTSLHRIGRTRLERYCAEALVDFNAQAEATLGIRLNLLDGHDYAMSLGLAQHHGLPTPLLDWTLSPYIAAFFAFADAIELSSTRPQATHVRIYGVTRPVVETLSPPNVTLPLFRPYLSFLTISGRNNPRLHAQQGRFLVTNIADLESHLSYVEKDSGIKMLVAVDIPISCAAEALEDLYFMGLSAATMFPGLDGVCRMMKHVMLFKH